MKSVNLYDNFAIKPSEHTVSDAIRLVHDFKTLPYHRERGDKT